MVQECVGVSEEVFNVYIFLKHSRRYKKKNKLKDVVKNQDIKGNIFKI